METKSEIHVAVHPGRIIKRELVARGIKQRDFAERLGLGQSHLSEIINGRRNINGAIAESLQRELDIDARSWLRMQALYDSDTEYLREHGDKADTQYVKQQQQNKEYIARIIGNAHSVDTGETLHFHIELYVYREDDHFLAYCPSVDMIGSGKNMNAAVMDFYSEFGQFLNNCKDTDEIEERLVRCGWKVRKHTPQPPSFRRQARGERLSKLLNSKTVYRREIVPVEIPAL